MGCLIILGTGVIVWMTFVRAVIFASSIKGALCGLVVIGFEIIGANILISKLQNSKSFIDWGQYAADAEYIGFNPQKSKSALARGSLSHKLQVTEKEKADAESVNDHKLVSSKERSIRSIKEQMAKVEKELTEEINDLREKRRRGDEEERRIRAEISRTDDKKNKKIAELTALLKTEDFDSLEKMLDKGMGFVNKKQWDNAFFIFKEITEIYMDDYRGWWGMTKCHTRGLVGYFSEDAKACFDKALANAPRDDKQKIGEEYSRSFNNYVKKIKFLKDAQLHKHVTIVKNNLTKSDCVIYTSKEKYVLFFDMTLKEFDYAEWCLDERGGISLGNFITEGIVLPSNKLDLDNYMIWHRRFFFKPVKPLNDVGFFSIFDSLEQKELFFWLAYVNNDCSKIHVLPVPAGKSSDTLTFATTWPVAQLSK